MIRLDEILEALPEVGLAVRRLDQWPPSDGGDAWWTCVLEDGTGCNNMHRGATPLEAVTGSLAKAGITLEDT